MGHHRTRWQARLEGRDGEQMVEVDQRRIRTMRRSQTILAEVEDENLTIRLRLGLRVR
jgi:hypothetical protein